MKLTALAVACACALAAVFASSALGHRTIGWPPHHKLWMCIHGDRALGSPQPNEASSWHDHDSGGNGHYGGLQMSWDWDGLVPGDAGRLSQLRQERIAEVGYSRSGYSRSWLAGQWGQTIGPCWSYV